MNKSKTAVIVDTGCDLPQEVIERYDIRVLRLKIMYHEGCYSDDLDIKASTIYERFAEEVPKTSTPNHAEVKELIDRIWEDGYENIIGITISSGLSGTYNVLATSLEEVKEKKVFAFDTKNISIGSGLLAYWAAEQLDKGAAFESVKAGLQRKIQDSRLVFYMDTLEYLRKGGRITPSVAIVGKMLGIKPIIACNEDGVYYTVAKIRGSQKGVNKCLEVAIQTAQNIQNGKIWVAVMNGDAPELSEMAKEQILKEFPQAQIVVDKQITPSMAIHTGPGLLGIGIFAHEDL